MLKANASCARGRPEQPWSQGRPSGRCYNGLNSRVSRGRCRMAKPVASSRNRWNEYITATGVRCKATTALHGPLSHHGRNSSCRVAVPRPWRIIPPRNRQISQPPRGTRATVEYAARNSRVAGRPFIRPVSTDTRYDPPVPAALAR